MVTSRPSIPEHIHFRNHDNDDDDDGGVSIMQLSVSEGISIGSVNLLL